MTRTACPLQCNVCVEDALESEPTALSEIGNDIEQHAPIEAPQTGVDALTAVLCAMSSRLDPTQFAELMELLPQDFRSVLDACSVERDRTLGGLSTIDRIAQELDMPSSDADWTASVVLEALMERLPLAASERLADLLPTELRHPKARAPRGSSI